MEKVKLIIRGNEGYIDALMLSSYNKSKHLFDEHTTELSKKLRHNTLDGIYACVFVKFEEGENEIWDILYNDVLNPSHIGKLEDFTDEWNTEEI